MMQLTLIFLVLFFGICDPDFWIRSSSFDCGSAYLKHSFHVIHSHSLVLQGVQEKLCFFTIHCNPSPAYIAVRDLQSSQRNASVQSESIYLHNCFSQLFLRQSSSENINHTMVSQTICIREHQPYNNGFVDHLYQKA